MLAPDDRQLLLTHLQPPPGLRLRHAVGTTFTLDLDAALLAPLGAATRVLHEASQRHALAVLEALRRSVDRIDIFYQNGYLAAPSSHTRLSAFLEQALHPVRPPRAGHLFHPKLWVLEFDDPDTDAAPDYRLIVATRNLTSSVSWDVMVSLDGTSGSRPLARNRPLAALVRSLPGLAHQDLPAGRADRIASLAESLRRVEWTTPTGVDDIVFHAFGIAGESASPDFGGDRGLIVSPYLSAGGVERVAAGMSELHIVGRADQLALLSPAEIESVEATGIHVVRADAGLGDARDSTASEADDEVGAPAPAALLDSLHAKIIVAERGARAHFFTGSVNATDNAFTGNVEFLLEIVGHRREYGIDPILRTDDGMGAILEPFSRPDQEPQQDDPRDALLDAALLDLTALHLTCSLSGVAADLTAQISSAEQVSLPAGVEATVGIAGVPGRSVRLLSGARIEGEVAGLAIEDVTAWALLTVTDERRETRSCLVKMQLIGDLEDRLDAVMAAQIDSTDTFLALLRLLLADDDDPSLGELDAALGEVGTAVFGQGVGHGLFEGLVRGLAHRPEALGTVSDLLEQLERRGAHEVIPDGLRAVWPAFVEAASRLTGARA